MVEFYKKIKLNPKIVEVYKTCLQLKTFPLSWVQANIIMFHKTGKDPTLPQSYCPISLLSIDNKILASILAASLNLVIVNYIHPDQSGFLKGR